jgi:hypothetical protein
MNLHLLLAFWLCYPIIVSGQPKISTKDFKVVSATKESWVPGTIADGSKANDGWMYQVTIELKKNGHFLFDSLITEAGSLPVEAVKNNIRNYKGLLKKGERIVLIAYKENQSSFTPNSNAIRGLISNKKNQPALISYHEGIRKCVTHIGGFEQKNSIQQNQ